MKLIRKAVSLLVVFGAISWFGSVISDRISLSEDVVRFHVVANSDSEEDQAVKLQVRDAVIEKLQSVMASLPSAEEAKAYLQEHLAEIKELANSVLSELGIKDRVDVSLQEACFDTRHYDTFSLPSGVYDALRITIGEGQGQNWWCVVFPTLCTVATSEDFTDTAVGSGFSNNLTGTLKQENGYEVRFFILDLLGKVQNFFFKR